MKRGLPQGCRASESRYAYGPPGDSPGCGVPVIANNDGGVLMRIREWTENDLERVMAITVAAWTPVYNGYLQAMGPDIFHTVHEGWQERKKRSILSSCRNGNGVSVYVVEIGGDVAAFIGYRVDTEQKCGVIWDNAVDPAYQGRGIASAMYRFVLEKMKERGMTVAAVVTGGDEAHIPARRAYEKAGFDKVVPSVRYYMRLGESD
ncbi:GNAT family N-acetyltransferase [Paenibacillus hemerocallicola]|uniref:GNAT family N-acetyltransferase n=1 Tax=Paenibacillus hemerocallicola TaxID=1172614 RepID=A0A5C4T8Y9_9BACL|nr:GNAT family N-acetyltransferase [Paenibacillus hemerocallicola]TNJ65020.1 GNAT family N-acetyltransferase [Paenibacillus hemerocallicola]